MRNYLLKILFLATSLALRMHAISQLPPGVLPTGTTSLYVSKQTGQFTSKSGVGSKTTDRYERGSVELEKQGPIKYEVNPAEFDIGINQTKNWKGKVFADLATAPEPGNAASATITGHYNIFYSRPAGAGTGGTVVSTYQCEGCYAHPNPGTHEIVNQIGDEEIHFVVYSIKVSVDNISCDGQNVTLHADVYPYGGKLTWATPWGPKEGNDIQVANVGNINPFNVTATYTIEGITATDTKTVNKSKLTGFALQCCSDKKVILKNIAVLRFDGQCRPDVVFNPPFLDIPAFVPRSEHVVTATGDGVTFKAGITMINSDRKAADKMQVPALKNGIQKTIDAWRKAIFDNSIASKLNGGVAPCKGKGNKVPRITLGVDLNNLCCPPDKEGCIKVGQKYYGEAKWAYGVNCHFPVLGVPYVASLDAVVSAGVSATINLNAQTTCAATKLCVGAELKATIGGGVGTTVLAGAVSADLQLVVDGIGVNGELCIRPMPVTGCLKVFLGKFKVVGNVQTLWGLTSNSVEYTIYEAGTFGPWCF